MDDREFDQWRAEHARNTDVESSPLSVAADEAGQALLAQHVGEAAVQWLGESPTEFADGTLQAFGQAVYERVDWEAVPARYELQQEIAEDEGATEELDVIIERMERVQEQRIAAGLEQFETGELQSLLSEHATSE